MPWSSNDVPMPALWRQVNADVDAFYRDGAIRWAAEKRAGLLMACDRIEAAIGGAMRKGERGRFLTLCVRYLAAWRALVDAFEASAGGAACP